MYKEISEKETHIPYKRVLLKLSGEAFGLEGVGLNLDSVAHVAETLAMVRHNTGVEMAIVVGAGNLFRGRYIEGTSVDRVTADYIGMMGTIMNAMALQEAMERLGNNTRVMSAIPINNLCEPFIRRKAIRHLEKGRMVILGGGTGNPFCTTDSASALRAAELGCQVLLKASNIDAVYDKDPRKHKNARRFDKISYQFALENGLKVMDMEAFARCQEAKIPTIIFNFDKPDNIEKIIKGESLGTLITV